ncbi:hypothetical protein P7K49_017132 [Saguinus oedipus]|uniref:Uncharacterized protein n=1 Tax=Saguinus oedipus TaxID=9490 RepID=A0ABQ9V216_SAGOE|nr:hypothetical protein P7K49_017132 [Saguinus oedipus]
MAALTTHYYLDILAKEAGVEAEPVGGDVEPALKKEVPLEGTGAHCDVTGEKMAIARSAREAPGPGSSHSGVQSLASGPVSSDSTFQRPNPKESIPQHQSVLPTAPPPHQPAGCFFLHPCSRGSR